MLKNPFDSKGVTLEELDAMANYEDLRRQFNANPPDFENFSGQRQRKPKPKSKKPPLKQKQLPPMVAHPPQPSLNSFLPMPIGNASFTGSEASFLARQLQTEPPLYPILDQNPSAPLVKSKSAGDREKVNSSMTDFLEVETLRDLVIKLESQIDQCKRSIQLKDIELEKKDSKIKSIMGEMDHIQKTTANDLKRLQSEVGQR